MARQVRKAKKVIYVFCEGESEEEYVKCLRVAFSNVAALHIPPPVSTAYLRTPKANLTIQHDRLLECLVEHPVDASQGLEGKAPATLAGRLDEIIIELLDGVGGQGVQLDGTQGGLDVDSDVPPVVLYGTWLHAEARNVKKRCGICYCFLEWVGL